MKHPEILLNTMEPNKTFHGTLVASGVRSASTRERSTPTIEENLLQPDDEKIDALRASSAT